MRKLLFLLLMIGFGYSVSAAQINIKKKYAKDFNLCASAGKTCYRYNQAGWLWITTFYANDKTMFVTLYEHDAEGRKTSDQVMVFGRSNSGWVLKDPADISHKELKRFLKTFHTRFKESK